MAVVPMVVTAQGTYEGEGQTRDGENGKWTVMVYMSGDSSLSTNVLDDLEEM